MIEPYGLDLIESLAARLWHREDHIFVGNVMSWRPPFRFVRTELEYVPPPHRQEMVERG